MVNRCRATSKRSKQPCQRAPMQNGLCYMHGGATPSGMALPQTTTGRYSKHLPTRMGERYQQALADSELLAMREEVAVIDARLADVLGRVDTGESGHVWATLGKAWRAYRTGPPEKRMEAEAQISDLILTGTSDYEAWEDVRSLIDQRSRLVLGERQRLVQMQQMLSVEQAMTLMAAVADSVRKHCRDRDTLAAISSDLGKLVDVGAGRADQSVVAV
jgi:hypothetical protein